MATNRELRTALMAQEKLTQQGLSKRVQKKIKQLPMSTTEATYLLAHEAGIKIHKYLSPAEVEKVRQLHAQLGQIGTPQVQRPSVNGSTRRSASSGPREIRIGQSNRFTSAMLSPTKLSELKEMSELYPVFYMLENSMREVINRVMRAQFGTNWWDTELVSGKLKGVHKKAADRMQTETTKHRWHQRRGARPIDYVDIGDLGDIIVGKQAVFLPNILGVDVNWFIHNFMSELEPSRNVVCHMNPLLRTNADVVKTKQIRWEQIVAGAGAAIPSS